MPVTAKQEIKIQNWLKKNAPNSTCSMCGNNTWNIGDITAPTVTIQGRNMDISEDSRPMVQVICGQCAKVGLFDVNLIGLL